MDRCCQFSWLSLAAISNGIAKFHKFPRLPKNLAAISSGTLAKFHKNFWPRHYILWVYKKILIPICNIKYLVWIGSLSTLCEKLHLRKTFIILRKFRVNFMFEYPICINRHSFPDIFRRNVHADIWDNSLNWNCFLMPIGVRGPPFFFIFLQDQRFHTELWLESPHTCAPTPIECSNWLRLRLRTSFYH